MISCINTWPRCPSRHYLLPSRCQPIRMRPVQVLLGLLLGALLCGTGDAGMSSSGPYNIFVERISTCKDQGTNALNMSLHMYVDKQQGKKTFLHRGGFTVPFTATEIEAMELHGDFFLKKTNDYLLMYHYEGEFCKTMETIASEAYKSLRKSIGLDDEECVIKQGNYTIREWAVPFKLPTPMLEYGHYKVFAFFVFEKKVAGCVEVYAEVKPKY